MVALRRTGRAITRRCSLAALLAVAGIGLAAPAVRATAVLDGPPERLVVVLDETPSSGPGASDAERAVAERAGATWNASIVPGTFVAEAAAGRGAAVLAALRADPAVADADFDVAYEASDVTPNDPCLVRCLLGGQPAGQMALAKVGAGAAWDVTRGDPGILVAVLDTGVDQTHPDLAGKVVFGRNFTSGSASDQDGHGTMVAGIIAAQPDNGVGIAGLGWSTRVLSVKVLDDRGSGLGSVIAQGITYAAAQPGVRVINLSLQQQAGSVSDRAIEAAVANARGRGVLVVAAAGNEGTTTPAYPAALPGVVGVAASTLDDRISTASNRGRWVDVAAPGVDVLTTYPGARYAVADGTSFAAPFVSAGAALLMAANPQLRADEVASRLLASADRIEGTGSLVEWGRLEVSRALGGDYWLAGADGSVLAFGQARSFGSMEGVALRRPVVGLAATATRAGYWLVASDGGIFNFGDAGFFGSAGSLPLNKPIVGMAATPSGRGYWLVASDGGIFNYGDAGFFGSAGALPLNKPVVGMTPTPSGRGYWLVASDGGIFAYGDAGFYGSTGSITLNRPIVGMASTASGRGYWFVASDGGIFAYGDATFLGSTGASPPPSPVVGMASTASGRGYWFATADGGVLGYGDAPPGVSSGTVPADRPVVAIAAR